MYFCKRTYLTTLFTNNKLKDLNLTLIKSNFFRVYIKLNLFFMNQQTKYIIKVAEYTFIHYLIYLQLSDIN